MNPLGMEPLRLDPEPHTGRVRFREDYWTWCRRHQKAEHVSERTTAIHSTDGVAAHTEVCVRIGPFMSAREANRLGEIGYIGSRPPLGMEVEE